MIFHSYCEVVQCAFDYSKARETQHLLARPRCFTNYYLTYPTLQSFQVWF